jgi:uncharacterized protein (DUF849 family)
MLQKSPDPDVMTNDLIINFTPTGLIPTREMTPHVPLSVGEIVEDVHKAVELGITMVHIHAREAGTGIPSHKAEIYRDIIAGIRSYSQDLVICVSLSGRIVNSFEHRAEPLQLDGGEKPDMGSLTLSSLNFNTTASINSPETIQKLALEMKNRGIVPEFEAFDSGMINYARYLQRKNLVEAPYYFNLLFGNIACAQASLLHVGVMTGEMPQGSVWSLAGIGNDQLPMNSLAVAMGWGVRVGLEDNIWYDPARTKLARNIDLLRRIHDLASANDRKIMSPGKFRELLNLEKGFGKYGRKVSGL